MWEQELIDAEPAASAPPDTESAPPAAERWQDQDPDASRWWLRDRTEAALREQARRLRERTA